MRITLITACLNGGGVLRTAMESVWGQRIGGGVELEYIVADGGSDDGTVEILKEYESRTKDGFSYRWVSEKDEGMYDALNNGLALATGDYVGILNADDWLDGADVVARVAAAIGSGDAQCVFGNVRFVKEPGGRTRRVCFARGWRPWMLRWGYMPPHPSVFIARRCFAEWGGYVPSRAEYRIAGDFELLVRFFRGHGMTYRYMPVCTTVMRPGGASTKDARARVTLNREIVKANRANGCRCWWWMLLPKYAVKVWEVILPRLGLMG